MIKFLDLKAVNDSFGDELSEAVNRVLKSGWYLLGNEVGDFEKSYGSYIGSKHCIGVANGLDALRLIFRAYMELEMMKEGDEIIVPANTYIASILAITENRLKPVLVEPQINNYNIDVSLIEKSITARTRAIMVVHLYGRTCWSENLEDIAARYNLKIIEDNAQAAGAMTMAQSSERRAQEKKAQGTGHRAQEEMAQSSELRAQGKKEMTLKRTGSLGDAAGHSFYPGKNLGAIGDGGGVTTDDDELAAVVRSLANYGSSKKYVFEYQGLNSRLDEIQAAALNVKLRRLDHDNQRRREIAKCYIENIRNQGIILPENPTFDLSHVWHLFVVRSLFRERLQNYLIENGIQTLIHYPVPPHQQQAYKEWNDLIFPLTEKIHREVLSMPISQVMNDNEMEQVINIINKFSV